MKKMFFALILGLFALGAFGQADKTAPKYDLTRPNPKNETEMNSMTRMQEGSEVWRDDQKVFFRYVNGVWIPEPSGGSSSDLQLSSNILSLTDPITPSNAIDLATVPIIASAAQPLDNVSIFTNDIGYLTSASLSNYVDKTSNETIGGSKTFNGILTFNSYLNMQEVASYYGYEDGVSGRRWRFTADTGDYIFSKQPTASTTLVTSYDDIYKLNESGTPTDAIDLTTKSYVDSAISGSGSVPDDTGSSNGDVLTTDGSGIYTWETPTGISNVVEDTSPQFGGDVDMNGNEFVSEVVINQDGGGGADYSFHITNTALVGINPIIQFDRFQDYFSINNNESLNGATEADFSYLHMYNNGNTILGGSIQFPGEAVGLSGTEMLTISTSGVIGRQAIPSGGGFTNLTYTPASRLLESDTGTDVTLPLGTSSVPGLLPIGDKQILDYITLSNPIDLDALEFQVAGKFDQADVTTNLDTPDNENVPTTLAVANAIAENNLLEEIEVTASRSGLLTDANGMLNVNSASAVTYTVPTNASVSYPIGTVISLVQENTGTITIAYSGGVTGDAVSTNATGQKIALWKTGSDVWQVIAEPEPLNVTKAEVIATATITMDGWKMYDDSTADAGTITLSDCEPGEQVTVYINRASAPTLAGTGLTFNPLPNTTAFASATDMMIIFQVAFDGTTIDYYYVER